MYQPLQGVKALKLDPIAHIRTDFPDKFGIPRQSGLADTKGEIVFVPKYRNPDAVRGIEQYSHLWLLWEFSESARGTFSPTVRPPRLGGNERVGVFATRSPFRPNPIGLSCVKLEEVILGKDGPRLRVSGVDMKDGTPVYDIKPYIPYADCHPEAEGGFAERKKRECLAVDCPDIWTEKIPKEHRGVLFEILKQDPRPSYQEDAGRIYGMRYAGMEVKFCVEGDTLHICGIFPDDAGAAPGKSPW